MQRKHISIGDRYGRLTVIGKGKKVRNYRFYVVQCDCGSPAKEVNGISLTSGATTSCGCYHSEKVASVGKKNRKYAKCPFCDCTKLHNRGLCYKHYLEWSRNGFGTDQLNTYNEWMKKTPVDYRAKKPKVGDKPFWNSYEIFSKKNA